MAIFSILIAGSWWNYWRWYWERSEKSWTAS